MAAEVTDVPGSGGENSYGNLASNTLKSKKYLLNKCSNDKKQKRALYFMSDLL